MGERGLAGRLGANARPEWATTHHPLLKKQRNRKINNQQNRNNTKGKAKKNRKTQKNQNKTKEQTKH